MSDSLIRHTALPFSGDQQQQPDTARAAYWRSRDAILFTGRGRAADPEPPTVDERLGSLEGSVDSLSQTVDEVAVRVQEIESLQRRALDLLHEIQAFAARMDETMPGAVHDVEDPA